MTLQRGSGTGHLSRRNKQIKSSTDKSRHIFKPWGTSTSPTPVGGQHSRASTRRLLGNLGNNFLLQVIETPRMRGVMMDLVLTHKEKLVGNWKLKDSLVCSDHEVLDPYREESTQQTHCPGFQESSLWCLQGSVWRSIMG